MQPNSIACCDFPTTVLFIDDKQNYLNQIQLGLDEDLLYSFYTNPEQAIEFIKQNYKPTPYIKKWLTNDHTDVDVTAIHQQIYTPNRFNEVSLVIVDYDMPIMNGLEFCQKLGDLPIKKLMLTGRAGYDLGVEALNNGIVDRFILKGSDEFESNFNRIIKNMQQQYFYDLSKPILQSLSLNPYYCLNNPAFLSLFREVCAEQNVTEYYLIKDTGCFLLVDMSGNISWLAVKNEREMQHDYELAKNNETLRKLSDTIKLREKLLFYLNSRDLTNQLEKNRQNYLYPANKIQNEHETMYYSIIEGAQRYDIDKSKITAFQQHLNTL
ncbi:MAG: response regulator [Gammaproteobacteria bacterium]|nr:response regulator [Gammaproteobacteria bacterium]